MHSYMDTKCVNCNKFSHCNNNNLICVSKYKQVALIFAQLKEALDELSDNDYYKTIIDVLKDIIGDEK